MPHPCHIYIHVPFCARRCSYCDFAIAVRRQVPVDEYVIALARELSLRYPADAQWCASTLYLGGGTPSRLGGRGVARVLDLVRSRVELEADAEITVEANPDDVTAERARTWRESGVNRLSIGAQSFDPATLAWMHRTHTAAQVGEAVANARRAGIEEVSLDLIFAVPRALRRSWEYDLMRAIELAPSHLSVYGLTIEPGTPLGRWRDRGEAVEAPEERYEDEFLLAHRLLTAAGFEHYEVSNYALPGRHARHNSAYWQDRPYAGLGPSAHSFDGRTRRWNVAPYAEWTRRLSQGADPIGGDEVLTRDQRFVERVYIDLRTTRGLELEPSALAHVTQWIDAGWAEVRGSRVRLTPAGWLRLDALASSLTPSGSRY